MHKYFIRNTKIGETSTEPFTYSLRSHKRLTLLVEDACIAYDASKQIKRYRRERKLTQIQLAQMLNVTHTTIKRLERNESKPSIDKVKEMFSI